LPHLDALDGDVLLRTDVLLLQARAARLVHEVEGDLRRRLARGKELHRDGHEAEGDGGGAYGVCGHGSVSLRLANRAPGDAAARPPRCQNPGVPTRRDTDPLAAYRAKRSAEKTTEPFETGAPTPGASIFVVHKHAARRLHYDLRLEVGGTLRSWAVPNGPS